MLKPGSCWIYGPGVSHSWPSRAGLVNTLRLLCGHSSEYVLTVVVSFVDDSRWSCSVRVPFFVDLSAVSDGWEVIKVHEVGCWDEVVLPNVWQTSKKIFRIKLLPKFCSLYEFTKIKSNLNSNWTQLLATLHTCSDKPNKPPEVTVIAHTSLVLFWGGYV